MNQPRKCQVLDKDKKLCGKRVHKRGFCVDHFLEWKKFKANRALQQVVSEGRQAERKVREMLAHPSGRQLKRVRKFVRRGGTWP